ncbi:L-cysteine desulfhydrase [Smittium culicis]|uniref:L-cysteine desulfhydrase n=1 Tax=Smittium culicis TaxID=133412 RepID=A0A1R1XQZ0_9FUNG|nr:L-cysteine desulfhydrase [Smittium culicis]OMJ19643.1 L-cysteine desulfhydrase [Smittium culicis]OMJ24957.1 L-cysteine desulfhydrase [Smittium culicis]
MTNTHKALDPNSLDESLKAIKKPELFISGHFGKKIKSNFLMNQDFLSLNHGSYGSCPIYVQEYVEYYSRIADYNPVRFVLHTLKPLYFDSLERISPYLGVEDPKQLTYISNACAALNSILRSMKFEEGDILIHYSTTFDACINAIQYICDNSKAKAVKIELNFPMTNDEILSATKESISNIKKDSNKRIRLALIDAIISVPGIVLPYKELAKIFKQEESLVFIDAAHAIGMLDIDIDSTGCDYFVTIAHKWFFSKRGCAIFYVANHLKSSTHPLCISHSYNQVNNFNDSFFQQGGIDYSTYLSSNASIDFIESLGGLKKIQNYCSNLAKQAVDMLESKYDFTPMTRDRSQTCFMINVKIPLEYGNPIHDKLGCSISNIMLLKYNISGKVFSHNNAWWARLSAQIFLELSDFDTYAQFLLKTIDEELGK